MACELGFKVLTEFKSISVWNTFLFFEIYWLFWFFSIITRCLFLKDFKIYQQIECTMFSFIWKQCPLFMWLHSLSQILCSICLPLFSWLTLLDLPTYWLYFFSKEHLNCLLLFIIFQFVDFWICSCDFP